MENNLKALAEYYLSEPTTGLGANLTLYKISLDIFTDKELPSLTSKPRIISRQVFKNYRGGRLLEVVKTGKDMLLLTSHRFSHKEKEEDKEQRVDQLSLSFYRGKEPYPVHVIDLPVSTPKKQTQCFISKFGGRFRVVTQVLTDKKRIISIEVADYEINPHTFFVEDWAYKADLEKNNFKANGKQLIPIRLGKAVLLSSGPPAHFSLIYLIVGLGVLALIGAGLGFYFYRRNQLMKAYQESFREKAIKI